MNPKKYFTIEFVSEIVEAASKEEAIKIGKQRIADRSVEVDEENTSEIEDEDLLREIAQDEERDQTPAEEQRERAIRSHEVWQENHV